MLHGPRMAFSTASGCAKGSARDIVQDSALLVDYPGSYLRAADVDADAERRRQSARPCCGATRPVCGQPSTLFLRPLSALSMIVFSALRLNIPIIGMLMSTANVYVTVVPAPLVFST